MEYLLVGKVGLVSPLVCFKIICFGSFRATLRRVVSARTSSSYKWIIFINSKRRTDPIMWTIGSSSFCISLSIEAMILYLYLIVRQHFTYR